MLSTIAEIIRDLLIFVGVIAAAHRSDRDRLYDALHQSAEAGY